MIKSLIELIAELDKETKRSEEWRKAQGIPRTTYQMSKAFSRVLCVIDRKEEHNED